MSAILDTIPYPWPDLAAQELHRTLLTLHPTVPAAIGVAQKAGLDVTYINGNQAPVFVWNEILDQAAPAGLTRKLVATVRARLNAENPHIEFLDTLLANTQPRLSSEPANMDGTPVFLAGNDSISEPEALLYHDDLTLQIGRVPALIVTLQRLLERAPAVCRFVVDVHGQTMHGSGFRIADELLLTNWHVLHRHTDGMRATAATAEFGYEDDGAGGVLAATPIACDVKSIVTDPTDDWAVIRPLQPLRPEWPIVKLSEAVDPVTEAPAYIVQHPGGERKRLGFVRNQVSSFDNRLLHYLTDTEVGSSGSPVFDAGGLLIGLHHAGGTPQDVLGRAPVKKNEGIRIPRVLQGLQAKGVTTP